MAKPKTYFNVDSKKLLKTKGDRFSFQPFEPKKQNRFVIYFDNFEIPSWLIEGISPLKCVVNNGMFEWQTLFINLLDPIAPSVSQPIFNLIQNNIHELNFQIDQLDHCGISIGKWNIIGLIREINFGEHNYISEEFNKIQIIIHPTQVILEY